MPSLLKHKPRPLGLLRLQSAIIMALWLAWPVTHRLVAQSEPPRAAKRPTEKSAAVLQPSLHLADRIMQNIQIVGLEKTGWRFQDLSAGSPAESAIQQQVVRWGSWRGIVDRPAVWLSDGSWLAGEVSWSGKEMLGLQSRWLQLPPIPLRLVRGVVLAPAASLPDWISLQQSIQTAQGEDDIVWLNDRRRLSGVIDWSSLEGNTQLTLSTSGQTITVPLDSVIAVVASPALFDAPADAPVTIGLSDGSLLNAREIQSTEARAVVSLSSLQLESLDRTAEFTKAITYLSNSNVDKVQWLDQLKPRSYRHVSENQLEYALGIGRDVNGYPLQVGTRRRSGIVFHGLALHSSAQAAYAWDRSPGKFLAEVQLAPSASAIGSALCKVLVARSGSLQTVAEFPLRAGEPATSHVVDVDITEAQLVVLVVEKADRGQFADHVLWLDARFVKP